MGRGSKYNQNTLYEILKIQLKKKKINEETKKNGQAESLSSSTHAGGLIGQRHPSPQTSSVNKMSAVKKGGNVK